MKNNQFHKQPDRDHRHTGWRASAKRLLIPVGMCVAQLHPDGTFAHVGANVARETHVSVQQQITVTGTVRDAEGKAIPGVSVRAKGTSTATSTDANGRYAIRAEKFFI